jgi:tRNA(Arg) A34 adenosine deaminase TadA
MTCDQIIQLGAEQLKTIRLNNTGVKDWKIRLADYQFVPGKPDDSFIWLTCVLALKAVSLGNFGIGCILVDADGNVVGRGHNEVFNPYFRSDRHAEMVVMDNFEDSHRGITGGGNYTLYTSLESCPMCLARLINSGIKRVLHAAPDRDGGMVHKMKDLPPTWIDLAKPHLYHQAACSPNMINAAGQIFLLNADKLHKKLKHD